MNKVNSKDGTPIAYKQLGTGSPLILVDGALCSSLMGPMPKLAPLLAKDFTVIYYDRRGRNESGDTKPYAVEREVEDIDALIRVAGGSAYVFGTSSGAALALAAAAAGLHISSLALYEPPFMIDKNDHRPPHDYHLNLTALADAGRRGAAVKYFMKAGIGLPSVIVFMMQLMPAWSTMKAVAHTLPYDAAIMGDFSLPAAKAASVKVSTLIAGGEKSQSWLHTAVRQLANVIPKSEFKMLQGQNHNVSVKVLAPVLTEFFKKQS
jgi:pimeloyl-ACP methyl ester carboxylesterase